MSTRAHIVISADNKNDVIAFYRHSDGYPSSTGEDLIEICKSAGWDKDKMVEGLNNSISEYTKRSYYEEVAYDRKISWDIQWLYLVNLPNHTIVAYELPGYGGKDLDIGEIVNHYKPQQIA